MSVELPKDAEGREIPLDTVVLFGGNGNAYNIVRWIFTTDFETWSEPNSWRAITEKHRALDPELMYLTPPDTWEKLEEDLKRQQIQRLTNAAPISVGMEPNAHRARQTMRTPARNSLWKTLHPASAS